MHDLDFLECFYTVVIAFTEVQDLSVSSSRLVFINAQILMEGFNKCHQLLSLHSGLGLCLTSVWLVIHALNLNALLRWHQFVSAASSMLCQILKRINYCEYCLITKDRCTWKCIHLSSCCRLSLSVLCCVVLQAPWRADCLLRVAFGQWPKVLMWFDPTKWFGFTGGKWAKKN